MPVIEVEVGNFTQDSTGTSPFVLLQNEQVARAYSRWPIDVINLGRGDLVYAEKLLARAGLGERTTALPMIKNIVSANGVFNPASVAAPREYVIKEVSVPRIKGKKIRVGFIGLVEPKRMAEGTDVRVKDMFETARRLVPEVRKSSDLVVILAHSEYGAALRLVRENPEADVVIVGNAEGIFRPRYIGNTFIVFAAPGNTQQGDLRLYVDKDGKLSVKSLLMDLDSKVPADPAASAFVEAARVEREKFRLGR